MIYFLGYTFPWVYVQDTSIRLAYWRGTCKVFGRPILIARTQYTGQSKSLPALAGAHMMMIAHATFSFVTEHEDNLAPFISWCDNIIMPCIMCCYFLLLYYIMLYYFFFMLYYIKSCYITLSWLLCVISPFSGNIWLAASIPQIIAEAGDPFWYRPCHSSRSIYWFNTMLMEEIMHQLATSGNYETL